MKWTRFTLAIIALIALLNRKRFVVLVRNLLKGKLSSRSAGQQTGW